MSCLYYYIQNKNEIAICKQAACAAWPVLLPRQAVWIRINRRDRKAEVPG